MADCHIYKLPNELLLSMLTLIPTPELLPLTTISHRIYALILRILQNRLRAASELQSHSLLLECYHPSAKLTEPAYFCTYLGTDGLSQYEQHSFDGHFGLVGRLGEMKKLYSRFRPYRRELEDGGRRVRGPPGDVPGSRTFPGTVQDRYEGDRVRQTLHLDENEPFTQLVAQCSLAKVGPRGGFPMSFVDVEEGVVRMEREWFRHMASKTAGATPDPVFEESGNSDKREAVREISPGRRDSHVHEIEETKWINYNREAAGLRFTVKERKIKRDVPILVRADEEDLPVSYEIEYDELLLRTSLLVLKLEESLLQEDNSGKAVIFGSFG